MYRRGLLGKHEEWLIKYESSMEEDIEITTEVITALKVHVEELMEQKLISKEQRDKIVKALDEILRNPDKIFKFKDYAEDIHEAIEIALEEIGEEAKLIGLGKSRNDHVATAIRLHLKKEISEIIKELQKFRKTLLEKAEEHVYTIMPSFTHLQSAQPTTLAHYLLYIEEEMEGYEDLLSYINNKVVDESPLGAGAITGSIVTINRNRMTEKLGMSKTIVNTIRATGSRSFIMITSSILTALQVTLSRIAEDLVIWSTNQFNYIQLPESHLSTSSIMPHKKNPVTMEILRAQAGEIIGENTAIMTIIKGLPSGYNLDLQEVTKHLWNITKIVKDSIKVIEDATSRMKVNYRRMRQDVENNPVIAAEIAELISVKCGIPYRKVHQMMAQALRESDNDIQEALNILKREIGIHANIPIRVQEYVKLKKNLGSPNPDHIKSIIEERKKNLTAI
jgi:argininosuccinate lyase